jgi:hypothetical protein
MKVNRYFGEHVVSILRVEEEAKHHEAGSKQSSAWLSTGYKTLCLNIATVVRISDPTK